MKTINLVPPGIFLGNTLFSYAHARGYAERHGYRLHVAPWVGQKIFQLDDPPIEHSFPRRTEFNVTEGEYDIEFHTYAQSQTALTYTRTQARSWFRFRPEVEAILQSVQSEVARPWVAHRRVGDYIGYGYVVPTIESYLRCARENGAHPESLVWVTEENPFKLPEFTGPLHSLPDFWRMMNASNLIRGNSTFSWWAHVLAVVSGQKIFAPLIDGIEGGAERDVAFVPGNWPRFANLAFVTNLRLRP